MTRESIHSRLCAGIVAVLLCAGGCKEAVRKTFYAYRTMDGALLEPVAAAELARDEGAADVDEEALMLVDAFVQRWETGGTDRANRELVVSVTFLSENGRPLARSAAMSFWVRRYDVTRYERTGDVVAAFHAGERVAAGAMRDTVLEKRHRFRLAMRKDSGLIAGAVTREKFLYIVVEAQAGGDDGAVLGAVSAPVRLENQ